jgi:arylsulfatase A-like enzyme
MKNNNYPNIIFLLIDGLRADHCFGKNKKANTPTIDSLTKSGIYFKNSISCTDITGYSMRSIFLSKFPFDCGKNKDRVEKTYSKKDSYLTTLKKSGYHLYAHMSKAVYNQGYQDVFENNDVTSTNSIYQGLTDKIIEKITSNSLEEPWFLYIHPEDVHVPCIVPNEFQKLNLEERYNLNLEAIDMGIKKILENIELSKTIIILTADHGEYLNPFDNYKGKQDETPFLNKIIKNSVKKIVPNSFHKSMHTKKLEIQNQIRNSNLKTPHEKRNLEERPGKHRMLFDDIVHVPLLFSGYGIPHIEPVIEQVGVIDIFPTITDILQIKHDHQIDGKSLKPLMNKKKYFDYPIYLENGILKTKINNSTSCIGLRTNNFKYFRDIDNPNENINLYNLKTDIYEDVNIAKENMDKIKEFEKIITELKNTKLIEDEDTCNNQESEEIERELKKLGYL